MIDRKEIDLLVRAQLKGKQDLESVVRSIGELEKAIESQAAAAKRGEASIDGLKATLLALQQVQERLKGQADLVGTFQRLSEQIQKTGERVSKTASAYEDYKTKLAGLAEVTDKQQDRLVKLSTAAERAQASFDKQQDRLAGIAGALREAGIATDDLAGAELRVRDAAAQIGVSIAQVQGHIEGYAATVKAARDATREKEQAEKEAIRTAEQFAAAEKRAADAERQRAEDAALVAQIVANRQAKSAADRNEFDNLADERKRAAELATMRSDAIAAFEELDRQEKQLAKNTALTQQADEAERAAKSYGTLARAATDLRPKTESLKDAIAAILDPARQARTTIEGLEAQAGKLATAIGAISGPVKDYRGQMRALAETAKGISNQASLIDDFQRQAAALRAARAEFVAARAKVAEYAAEVRKGGDDGERFTKALGEAQAAAGRAAQALQTQLAATRASRESLRAAGIAANDLTGAQQRLTSAARSTVASTEQLAGAMRKYGTEVEGTGRKHKFFEDSGRTTLSLMQRIRGEVLALTASYVGLQGAIGLAGSAADAAGKREGIKNQLSLSVGNDKAAIDAEYAYVKAQSERIGLEFDKAAEGFAKFSAAATLAGRTRTEIRFIWEAFAEVGRVANLSTDDMQGVFKALEQITSKGKIQAEELRGQLGDRLFGAFQVAAKALKDQFPDLDKAMEKGLVTADQLVAIADEYRKTVAEQLPAATKSFTAEQARLANATLDFKLAIADSGWLATYTDLIRQLTVFLRSEDGAKLAKDISEGFQNVGKALIWVVQNAELVKNVLLGIVSLAVAKWAIGLGLAIKSSADAFGGFGGVLKAGSLALTQFAAKWPILTAAIKGALGAIGAAFLGWQIGKWANDKFVEVRKAGVYLVTGLDEAWTRIKAGAQILWEEVPRYATNAFKTVLNIATAGVRGVLAIFQKGLDALGRSDMAANVGKVIDTITFKWEQQGDRVGQVKQQMEADIARIRAIRADMLKDAEKTPGVVASPTAATPGAAAVTPTAFPGKPKTGTPAGPSEADIAKRERAIEQITRALESLDAKIDRAQTDTLAKQLEAVDLQYAKLARQIAEIGGQAGADFMKRLAESTAQLKTQITAKFNADLLKDQEALQNRLEDLEAAAGKKSKFELDKRLEAIRKGYEDAYRDIEAFRAKLEANGLDTTPAVLAKQRLDAGIAELQNLERIKFAREELNRLEQATNDLISIRDQKIETIRAKEALGRMDDAQAAEEINRINAEAVPAIQAAADATILWAQAHAAIFGNPELMQLFIDKINAIRDAAAQVPVEFDAIGKAASNGAVNLINSSLGAMVDNLRAVTTGQKSVSQGFRDMGVAFLQFAAQFLQEIAVMIIKMMIFRALQSMGGFFGNVGNVGLASMGVKHDGGLVGGPPARTRRISSAWFANAPRYHSGGIPGLRPDEYATILQRNEEVLAADSPRNILNGGAGIKQPGQQAARGNRFILVDDRAKIAEHMRSAEGENVFIEFLERNVMTVRSIVSGG